DPALVEWTKIPYSVVASAEHDALATEMARKSMVLLQNKNNVLPLQANGLTVAVVGPNANDSVMQWANYNGTPARTITILQGIKNAVGEENVIYEEGCAWVADTLNGRKINPQAIAQRVQSADVIIFVGGITPRLEGEEMRVNWPGFRGGDRTDIELPAIQRQVVAALHNTGKPVVFVNCSGSALGLVPETETCDAILQAWYPGQSGGTAVADILFGKYNPAGRLPVTFYKNISQLPDFENYDMKGHTYRYNAETPLFPFGYGLSYTTFDYGVATFNMENPKAGQEIVLTVPVTNSGDRDGEEVVQVYLKKANDLEGPIKTLRAFKRVVIPAGQTLQVEIPLTSQQLEWWNADTNTMHTGAGLFEVMVGGSSRDSDLKRYELSLL
ncbi:MAG: glycoside hydrolase family 3 C-terminal domain-containing protein, partial [Prevotellaceae bacterium]|nr:glycoside hydrolase family 3 C-terminal domain-containing protein [Prevotellaceae bacterium]